MELFKEIINLVAVLAWPTVVLILGFAFKRQIADILLRIKGAKYKDLELEFREGLATAQGILSRKSMSTGQTAAAAPTDKLERIRELAELSPRALVTESWISLESDMVEAIEKSGVPKAANVQPFNTKALIDLKILDREDALLYDNLKQIRNKSVHDYDVRINKDQAVDYALTIEKFRNQLKTRRT